jgi:calcineurin-like phosphoesterase family protein
MGPGVDENFTLAMLASLNGELKILLGNHDQPNRKHKQKGLKKIIQDNHLPIEILPDIFNFQHDGKKFVMSHYPMSDWDGKFHGAIHLHGHSHAMVLHDPPEVIDHTMTQYPNGVWTESTNPCIKNRYDIGVDMYGGPVELTGDCRYLNSPKGWH